MNDTLRTVALWTIGVSMVGWVFVLYVNLRIYWLQKRGRR
jgi:hypothetical protein